jgi:hypothetical protein
VGQDRGLQPRAQDAVRAYVSGSRGRAGDEDADGDG